MNALIKKVQALLGHRNQDPLLQPFCQLFFQRTPQSLLQEKGAKDLSTIAQLLWSSFQNKPKDTPTLCVAPAPTFETSTPKTTITVLLDDSPFIVDSLTASLTRAGYYIHASLHTVLHVERSQEGILSLDAGDKHGTSNEVLIYIELEDRLDTEECQSLEANLKTILEDVRGAVTAWQPMRNHITDAVFDMDYGKALFKTHEKLEIQSFLQWLERGYFTFLGYREYGLQEKTYTLNPEESLGLLKGYTDRCFASLKEDGAPQKDKAFFITKTTRLSTVHRSVPMDVICIKKINEAGEICGERQFFGLFTSAAYNRSIQDIPLLRQKLKTLLEKSGTSPEWHSGKVLIHILESFPRDELFQSSVEDLYKTVRSVLHLKDRKKLGLFMRKDPMGHMASCLVYIPRDRFTSTLREKFSQIFERELKGQVLSFQTELGGDLDFARVHFLVAMGQTSTLPSTASLERILQEASMTWNDSLREHLPKKQAHRMVQAFSASYKESFSVQTALEDINVLRKTLETQTLSIHLLEGKEKKKKRFFLKLYQPNTPLSISDILPILENMGLKVITETPYEISLEEGTVWLHHFEVLLPTLQKSNGFKDIKDIFEGALQHIWSAHAEDDCLNSLSTHCLMEWQDVSLFRAYTRYLKQIGFPFDLPFMAKTLAQHTSITTGLLNLFYDLFDPRGKKLQETESAQAIRRLENRFKTVQDASEDRVLRAFLNLITSTLRTNYFTQAEDKSHKAYISLKLDGSLVSDLPLPRPAYEVFVYARFMEAVHLRGGKVARGGLRWSSRQDFRREILDLVKAQMVKNTVIVPVGAKGGFIIKDPIEHLSHEERQKKAVFCYQTMIRGLLDITDNMEKGKVLPPAHVVCRDGADPYLVVAADKGTATFSDIANGISGDYGYWLGDAFASGGSAGYDHKKMGITAKGAWVSVQRHFREMGLNVQNDPFTVVGVGDMSGDVFGNGMLLSDKIKLVGAFNHLHIFIDPTPDPKKSFKERTRLFKLPRSNWTDYDPKALSTGAMIINRQDKMVKVTPQVKKLLGIQKPQISPQEIVKRFLCLDSDLLWFGGIGTFVKASSQTHEDVSDRINDALRVNAADLRCKVIGEGANLGLTQLARIEYAANGGKVNTDAIDNSAGVDCSDHEVNIKILFQDPQVRKAINIEERNDLLEEMTEEVSSLTLRNNYLQSQAISMIQLRGHRVVGRQNRFMKAIEKIGKLNRDIEYLPRDKDLHDRLLKRRGLTRPEISVLLAYGKIFAFDQVIQTPLPDSPLLHKNLLEYFPKPLQERLEQAIHAHPLKREIIATFVANSLVNRVGPTFLNEMMDLANATTEEVMNAYLIVRESFALRDHWESIEKLDYMVESKAQYAMLLETLELIERNTLWLLRHKQKALNVSKDIESFSSGIQHIMGCVNASLSPLHKERKNTKLALLKGQKIPTALAEKSASLFLMNFAYSIIDTAQRSKKPVEETTKVFFTLMERLSIDWLLKSIRYTSTENNWTKRAAYALRDQLIETTSGLVESILKSPKNSEKSMTDWLAQEDRRIQKVDALLQELKSADALDLNMLFVVSHHLKEMI